MMSAPETASNNMASIGRAVAQPTAIVDNVDTTASANDTMKSISSTSTPTNGIILPRAMIGLVRNRYPNSISANPAMRDA